MGGERERTFLEGSLIIDIANIKVVEASLNKKLVLFAVGTTQKPDTTDSYGGDSEENEPKSRIDFEWKIFYDSTILPSFMSVDKFTSLMAGIVAVSSGSASVFNTSTVYIASGSKPSKGNAPVLLDYELTKKIEEARKRK